MSQNGFSFNLVLGHFWNINFAVLWSEMIEIWSVLLDAAFLQFPSERSETGKLRAAFFSNNLSKFSQFSHFFWSASHDHHFVTLRTFILTPMTMMVLAMTNASVFWADIGFDATRLHLVFPNLWSFSLNIFTNWTILPNFSLTEYLNLQKKKVLKQFLSNAISNSFHRLLEVFPTIPGFLFSPEQKIKNRGNHCWI